MKKLYYDFVSLQLQLEHVILGNREKHCINISFGIPLNWKVSKNWSHLLYFTQASHPFQSINEPGLRLKIQVMTVIDTCMATWL